MAFSRPSAGQWRGSASPINIVEPRFSIAVVVLAAHQDFALAGMVRLPDDAFLFHSFHDRGGAVIADLQPALDITRGRLLVAFHDLHRLLIEVAGLAAAHAGGVEHR